MQPLCSLVFFFVCFVRSQNILDLSPDREHSPFLYGVASGDPLSDRLLIWTKVESLIDVTVSWKLWQDNSNSSNSDYNNSSSESGVVGNGSSSSSSSSSNSESGVVGNGSSDSRSSRMSVRGDDGSIRNNENVTTTSSSAAFNSKINNNNTATDCNKQQSSSSSFNACGFSSSFPLRTGIVEAVAENDWTIIQEVEGLLPKTRYMYQFSIVDTNLSSVIGHTRTLPGADDISPVTLAVASCSSLWNGYFTAYREIAEDPRIDFVIHLGDFIYPDMAGSGVECVRIPSGMCYDNYIADFENWNTCRNAQPPGDEFFHIAKLNCSGTSAEPNFLQRFRWIHSLYLLDPNLRKARQYKPWVNIYDNHDHGDETGKYVDRLKAFFEYVPHRHRISEAGYVYSWRFFPIGKNLDLVMMDLRTWALNSSDFVGEEQWQWLQQALNVSASNRAAFALSTASNSSASASASTSTASASTSTASASASTSASTATSASAASASGAPWRMIGTQVQFSPFTLNDMHVVANRALVGILLCILALMTICGCSLCQCRKRAPHTQGCCAPHCSRCDNCCCMVTPACCAKCRCCISRDSSRQGCSNQCCGKCVNPCCPPCRGCFCCGIISLVVVIGIWIAAAIVLATTVGSEHLKYFTPSNRNWDGNPASRAHFLNLLEQQQNWNNNFWVAGDMHYTVVSDIFHFDDSHKNTLLEYNRDKFTGKRFGLEFLPASVSRGNVDEKVWELTGWQTHSTLNVWMSSFLDRAVSTINPQYRFFDGSRHGFGVFTFDQTQTRVEIRYFPILNRDQPMEVGYSAVFNHHS